LTLDGCTVVGKVHATLLQLISNTIFWAGLLAGDTWSTALISDRKQEGCVRFSFLPAGAKTPRRFECVERAIAGPQPIFFAFRYGRPGYLKLLTSTPDVVRRGADDGGEMGAFHFVLAPLRESDLRVRMAEYMPVGLEFGILYQHSLRFHLCVASAFRRTDNVRLKPDATKKSDGTGAHREFRQEPFHVQPAEGLLRSCHAAGPRPAGCGLERMARGADASHAGRHAGHPRP